MTAPEVKVEIKFNGTWADVSEYVSLAPGSEISITRGRASEVDTTQPGTCSLLLDNTDGRFTPKSPASPCFPGVVPFVPIRVQVSTDAGATWRDRFTGYVEAWPVSFVAGVALSVVRLTAVDLLGLAGLTPLSCYAANQIRALDPVAYYPLSEDTAATWADDISGHHQPRLDKTQRGTGGTFEFGNRDNLPTPMEGVGWALVTPAGANTNGIYLLSSSAMSSFGTEFTVVVLAKPAASGYIWQIQQGTYRLALYYDSSASKYRVRQYNGSSWSTLVSTSATVTGTYCEVLTVTATHVTLRSDATRTATARAAATFSSPTVYVGMCDDATSGFDDLLNGNVGQLAIIGRALTMTATTGEADVLAGRITQASVGFTQYADDLLEGALAWAGFDGETVDYLGTRTELGFVATNGETVASLGDKLSRGTLGRCAVNPSGSLTWIGADYSPTIVELDAGDVDPSFEWVTDRGAYVTDLTTTLPSGGNYTYASATAGLIRASREIVGVLPTDAECKELAQFIVSGSSLDPRIPNCTFDLLTLDTAIVDELLDLESGAVLSLSNLPSQIPDDQVLVVEGVVEKVGVKAWSLEFNTSPSSRIIPPAGWAFLVLDDATYGTLDTATNILATI